MVLVESRDAYCPISCTLGVLAVGPPSNDGGASPRHGA